MAATSAAPVYVAYETQIGTGAVGGVIPTFDAIGRQTGAIVATLLEGKPPAALELPRVLHGEPLVDWRQVRRWGIDEKLLPAGTSYGSNSLRSGSNPIRTSSERLPSSRFRQH